MDTYRRSFLKISATATGFALCGLPVVAQRDRRQKQSPAAAPTVTDPVPHFDPGQPIDPEAQRLLLEQRKRKFRESFGELTDRVSELEYLVRDVDAVNFFSVRLYKQTDAIEHAAKRLKSLAKN